MSKCATSAAASTNTAVPVAIFGRPALCTSRPGRSFAAGDAAALNQYVGGKTEDRWNILKNTFEGNILSADSSRWSAQVGHPYRWNNHGARARSFHDDRIGAGAV